MMLPPTALPRSLAENVNPRPADPRVPDRPNADGATDRPPLLLARLFRRGGRLAYTRLSAKDS
jgi:hypothetical protein